jgi:hypothetical protein
MASFIDPLPAATGTVGLAAAASDLGSDTRVASTRASELPKTVIHPFIGASVALGRGELRFASGYHTSDARRPRPTAPPLDSNLTW